MTPSPISETIQMRSGGLYQALHRPQFPKEACEISQSRRTAPVSAIQRLG